MPEHVSLWHPWKDKPGQRHTPTLWKDIENMDIDTLVQYVGQNQIYCFCNDILDEEEIPQSEALLLHKDTESYISRTGKVVALRAMSKRKSGFFIPGDVWGCKNEPNYRLLEVVNRIFKRFQYEAITPASLSEKVLRSTLPDRLFISRPSDMLRRTMIGQNKKGGRIDQRRTATRHQVIYSYDETKSYLYHSRKVVSPFKAPHTLYYGDGGHQDDRWYDYAASWLECYLVAHNGGIQPIQVEDNGVMRQPYEGEKIHQWLWGKELEDCLNKGYTLEHIERGYGWEEESNFMEEWSDILWEAFESVDDPAEKNIIKTMMVGLPGRFLKDPEIFSLVHYSEKQRGDVPVLANWKDSSSNIFTNWYIRSTPDLQSAQLTPIGSYIVMNCRQNLYHLMREEEARGNTVLSSYIDCYTVSESTRMPEILGKERGQFKEKIETDVVVDGNKIIPKDISKMRAPGFAIVMDEEGNISGERAQLWRKHHGTTNTTTTTIQLSQHEEA